MCTVRSGRWRPEADERGRWRCRRRGRPRRPSTSVRRSSAASCAARAGGHAHAGRVVGPGLEEERRRLAAPARPPGRRARCPASSSGRPIVSAPSCSSRSSSGGKHGFSTSTRSPRRTTIDGDAVEGVHGAVHDGERLGRERPPRPQDLVERGQRPGRRGSWWSASAGRPGPATGPRSGSSVGVGGAGREVERGSGPGPSVTRR